VSGNINVGCAGLIAGKPAPTVFVVNLVFASTPIPCGSGLARDGGVSGDIDVGCAGLIAGKPAPTVFVVSPDICNHPQSLVGAGLLAMTVCQVALILNVLASSLASQLPQFLW
jgi:hypothetical protein